jgi:hypothetical protein
MPAAKKHKGTLIALHECHALGTIVQVEEETFILIQPLEVEDALERDPVFFDSAAARSQVGTTLYWYVARKVLRTDPDVT